MSSTADVILYGGSIITMDEKNPSAEALAVTGNIITAVGKLDEVFALAGETTKVIYLNQKTLLPGFIEPHTHATALVLVNTAYTNISGYDYHTYNDVNEKMKETIGKLDTETSPLPWALFFGWDPELIPSLPLLSADFLDKEFSSEVPVVVVGQSGHVAWVNRKAFEVANVDDSIENADGGVFVKDDEGHLTGQLFEVYAIERVTSYAPQPTLSDLQTKIKDQWKDFASRGFTTVTEMAYQRNPAFDILLLKESEQRDCPIRLALYQVVYGPENSIKEEKSSTRSHYQCCPSLLRIDDSMDGSLDQDEPIIEGSDKLWVAGVKVIADGSPHCGTAAVQEPYLNSNLTEILGFPEAPQYGTLNYTTDELLEIVQSYHKKGTQIAIHAHGERAIDQVLTVYEQVVSKVPKDTCHRIEHLGLATVDSIAQAGELKLALSFFVCHLYFYAKSYAEYIFGRERTDRWTPLSEASKHGLLWSIHQDHPTFPGPGPLPMANLKTAVTRTCRDDKETVYGPEYRVSIHEALKAYTINAAWQIHKDDELGSLEVNKKADLLVLSKNPYQVDPMELESIEVVDTFMDGHRTKLSKLSKVSGGKFLVFDD